MPSAFLPPEARAAFPVATDGKTKAASAAPANPKPHEAYAARVLARYPGLVTGGDTLKGRGLFQKAIEATKDGLRANAQIRKSHVAAVALMLTRKNIDLRRKAKKLRIKS